MLIFFIFHNFSILCHLGMVRDHTIDVYYFLSIYIALGVINSVIVIIRAFLFAYGGVRAAKRIHKSLLSSVVQVRSVDYFVGILCFSFAP